MSTQPTTCARCGSVEIHFRKSRGEWICDACDHRWTPPAAPEPAVAAKTRLFLSYGRDDAGPLAERLQGDLTAQGYDVWRDQRQIRSGKDWMLEIEDGLRSTQLVVALLSPHAVRRARDPANPDKMDSV